MASPFALWIDVLFCCVETRDWCATRALSIDVNLFGENARKKVMGKVMNTVCATTSWPPMGSLRRMRWWGALGGGYRIARAPPQAERAVYKHFMQFYNVVRNHLGARAVGRENGAHWVTFHGASDATILWCEFVLAPAGPSR